MTIAAEVRGHHGYGYDPVTRGHFGYWWAETAPIVVATPTKHTRSRVTGAPGGALWAPPRELVLDEDALLELARETAELSLKPELRTWASSVLSQAGRRGTDLATETAVARVLLAEVQPMTTLPLAKTAHLGAGLLAVGLHVTLVAHGQVRLTKTLVAVYADGGWVYADPHGSFELGETVPFKVEKFVPVPNLAPPEPVAEPVVATTAPAVTWLDVQAPPQPTETDLLMQKIIRSILSSLEPETPAPSTWKPIHTVIVVGALGIAALALWQVYKVRKELEETRTNPRPRRSRR